MEPTRKLLSWSNGTKTIERITTDETGSIVCPNDFPHEAHKNAIWHDWDKPEVWECSGQAYANLDN
jgi:hypothetical protein